MAGPHGIIPAAATVIGRRVLAPRAAASAAAGVGFLEKISSKIPSLEPQYQQALQSAAQRGGNAVAVTHFLLGNQDPEYRKHFSGEDK